MPGLRQVRIPLDDSGPFLVAFDRHQIHPLFVGHGGPVLEEWFGVGAYRVAQLPGVAPHDLNHFVSYHEWRDWLLERSIEKRIQTPFVRIASIRRNLPPFAENRSRNHARLDD